METPRSGHQDFCGCAGVSSGDFQVVRQPPQKEGDGHGGGHQQEGEDHGDEVPHRPNPSAPIRPCARTEFREALHGVPPGPCARTVGRLCQPACEARRPRGLRIRPGHGTPDGVAPGKPKQLVKAQPEWFNRFAGTCRRCRDRAGRLQPTVLPGPTVTARWR